ncbi:MAG: TetR/AcrR family transcriptional regulator [Chloroflexota bacterium]|nr:TetR/AcrR family transcriptional regulator [Chloroflexota bacterium]
MDRFEQRKLTRARLIDGALKLFSANGYDHATIDDISQEAGYSKGAYYFHFSTKEDILLELLRRWSDDRASGLAAVGGSDGARDLRATLEALFSYEREPRWPGMLLEFWAQSMRNDEVKKRLAQVYGACRQELAASFADAAQAGAVRAGSADEAAGIALAAHDGYVVQLAIGSPAGKLMTPAQLADALLSPLEAAPSGKRRAAAV